MRCRRLLEIELSMRMQAEAGADPSTGEEYLVSWRGQDSSQNT